MSVVGITLCVPKSTALANDRVYVTVRKKAEPEKTLPATVRVFGKGDIAQSRLQSPTDISSRVTGFSFNDPFGRFNPAPSMRGLIQPGLGDEPSVGFFNDGMYLSGRSSINSLAFDLERIEVAKGPQNALYGRNTFGGAINAISAMPTQKAEMGIDAQYGTKDRMQSTAYVSGPINDVLSARLALYMRDWGGYYSNTTANGPEIGREQTQAGRLTLRYTPQPTRDIVLRLTQVHDDDSQPKGFLVPANCGTSTITGLPRYYCGELPEDGSPYGANAGHDGYQRSHSRAQVEWTENLSDETTLNVMVGGSTEESKFSRDDDFSGTQAARAGIDTRRYDAQADARLNYTPDHRKWEGLVGMSLYHFFNHTHRMDQYYVLGQTRPGGPVVNTYTDTASLYGSVAFALPADFKLTLDGRMQQEWKALRSDIRDLSGTPLDLSDSWRAFTPKITLSWQENPADILVYGSIGKGYKSGGFNERANIFDGERSFGPEQNWTYEAGIKNIPVRENLSFDLSAFYIDWQDQQVLAYSSAGTTNNFFLNNSAQSTVKGIETALRWQPTANTNINFYYTYADARFDSYNDPDLRTVQGFAPTGDVGGNRLPRYSPHHFGAELENRRSLETLDAWEWVNTAQLSFQSSQYTDNANLAKTGNRTLLNLQTGVDSGAAYAGIYVDNALNERDPSVGISWSDARAGFSRAWLVVPQDGTTIGVRGKLKF